MCEVALVHAFASGIIREAVFGVDAWDLALEQTVSDLDRLWQAFFAYFASVFSFFTLVEHDGFGPTPRRRIWVLGQAVKSELRYRWRILAAELVDCSLVGVLCIHNNLNKNSRPSLINRGEVKTE